MLGIDQQIQDRLLENMRVDTANKRPFRELKDQLDMMNLRLRAEKVSQLPDGLVKIEPLQFELALTHKLQEIAQNPFKPFRLAEQRGNPRSTAAGHILWIHRRFGGIGCGDLFPVLVE